MYRKIALLSVLLLMAVAGFSQSTNFGISMGANFSNLVGRNKIEGSSPRIGVCPGLLLDIPMAYESYLEIGAIYSQQGVRIKNEDEFPQKPNVRVKMVQTRFVDYVTVPIQWKETLGDIYVKAGPFVSLALQAKAKMKCDTIFGTDSTHTFDSSKDTTELGAAFNQSFINSLRQFDVGLSFNVGFQTSISRGMDLFFDAGYKIGFFSVEENPKVKNSPLRNQYFSITAGIFFVKSRGSRTYRRR